MEKQEVCGVSCVHFFSLEGTPPFSSHLWEKGGLLTHSQAGPATSPLSPFSPNCVLGFPHDSWVLLLLFDMLSVHSKDHCIRHLLDSSPRKQHYSHEFHFHQDFSICSHKMLSILLTFFLDICSIASSLLLTSSKNLFWFSQSVVTLKSLSTEAFLCRVYSLDIRPHSVFQYFGPIPLSLVYPWISLGHLTTFSFWLILCRLSPSYWVPFSFQNGLSLFKSQPGTRDDFVGKVPAV